MSPQISQVTAEDIADDALRFADEEPGLPPLRCAEVIAAGCADDSPGLPPLRCAEDVVVGSDDEAPGFRSEPVGESSFTMN